MRPLIIKILIKVMITTNNTNFKYYLILKIIKGSTTTPSLLFLIFLLGF